MTLNTPHLQMVQLALAGAATAGTLALFGAAHEPVRPTDVAASPQTPPNLLGGNGFAADGEDDNDQLQQQLNQQQLQQSMQQAEQQNEQAQQQFEQGMQQAQLDEQQANNP